jgi:type IV secretion system protein VirB4
MPEKTLYHVAMGLHQAGHTALAQRLTPWFGEGAMAHLFGYAEDTLDLKQKIQGFEMGRLLAVPGAVKPVLLYLLFRIHRMLDGKPTLIVFDDAWSMLDNNVFMPKIGPWLQKFRERNAMVLFATESVQQAAEGRISNDIMDHISTEIYLPNPEAGAAYQQVFRLNDREFSLLRRMRKELRHFLLKHNGEAIIGQLNLADMDDVLCVLAGNAVHRQLLAEIQQQVGESPVDWLPVFQDRATDEQAKPPAKEVAA